jgi:RNA polymerase sigma-70 factor (ECF subfamily)
VREPIAEAVRPEDARASELDAIFASEAAFRAFYDRALPRVYGYLVSRCHGDVTLAEDLTQLTFTTAVRERRSYDGRSDPVTWLVGIARHKLVDHFRAVDREESRLLKLAVREIAMETTRDPWSRADERQHLVAALARLPAMQRAVLVLHYADGLPVRELAREIGRSESATESLLTRAREGLRTILGEAGDD